MASGCTSELLQAAIKAGNACQYVKDACDKYEFFNFMNFRFCTLEANTGLNNFIFIATMVVLDHAKIILVLISFMVLGSVAETYLTPVLTLISDSLDLSETISGVTLLAFANGAPDILAVISAAGGDDGIYIAVGNLFGACLFAITLVVGRCIGLCPKPIVMEPQFWNRDLIFYFITLCLVLAYGIIGHITLPLSLAFFGIYGVYLLVVIYVIEHHPAKFQKKQRRRRTGQSIPKRRASKTNGHDYKKVKSW